MQTLLLSQLWSDTALCEGFQQPYALITQLLRTSQISYSASYLLFVSTTSPSSYLPLEK